MQQWNTHLPWKNCLQYLPLSNLMALKMDSKKQKACSIWEVFGHTAVIHTENEELQLQYGIRMKACRVLVNSPSAEGGIGNIYNNMIPSLTLGCGSHGHNSISHNVSSFDLLNVKTLLKRRNNMQWFRVPPKIFFEKDSITYLRHIEADRVMLVCDPGMVQIGYADLVKRQLELNRHRPAVDVFSDVEPNPIYEYSL